MVAVGLTVSVIASLTACGKKNYTITDLKTMNVEKYVTLPEYKGMDVTVDAKQEVTDQDVSYYIQSKMNDDDQFHSTTGTVEDGEMVDISYVGTIDGTAFDGGTADDQLLQIGSDTYIDGFESGLIGAAVGDTVTLNLTFPTTYSNTDLAGQDCVFTVTINYIVTPLSDDNVNLVDSDYTDAASYEAATETMLENYVDYQYEYSLKSAIATQLIDGCTYTDIPQSLIDSFEDDVTDSLTSTAESSGTDLATYMENTYSISADDVDSTLESMAEQCTKEGLALQAIANAEDLNVSDDDLNAEISTEASAAGYDTVDDYLGTDGDEEDIRLNMMYDNVYQFLIDNANITES